MSQSNVIFAYILIAYLLFITLKGELPTYITLLRGGGQQAEQAGGITINGQSLNSVAQGAASLSKSANSLVNSGEDLFNLAPPSSDSSAEYDSYFTQ